MERKCCDTNTTSYVPSLSGVQPVLLGICRWKPLYRKLAIIAATTMNRALVAVDAVEDRSAPRLR